MILDRIVTGINVRVGLATVCSGLICFGTAGLSCAETSYIGSIKVSIRFNERIWTGRVSLT